MTSFNDAADVPRGFFQTNDKSGLIFPVMKVGEQFQMQKIPVRNNCAGENIALELMKNPSFLDWGIDPWTGKVNITFMP